MQLDMQSKRIFNVLLLVQIQNAVHSGMLMYFFSGDRHTLAFHILDSYHLHTCHYKPHCRPCRDEAALKKERARIDFLTMFKE